MVVFHNCQYGKRPYGPRQQHQLHTLHVLNYYIITLAVSSLWVLVFKGAFLRNYATIFLQNFSFYVKLIYNLQLLGKKDVLILRTCVQVTVICNAVPVFLRQCIYRNL